MRVLTEFRNGVAIANHNDKYFHINKNMERLYEKSFDDVTVFRNDIAVVKNRGYYFHINKKGKRVHMLKLKENKSFRNGVLETFTIDDERVLIQITGRVFYL